MTSEPLSHTYATCRHTVWLTREVCHIQPITVQWSWLTAWRGGACYVNEFFSWASIGQASLHLPGISKVCTQIGITDENWLYAKSAQPHHGIMQQFKRGGKAYFLPTLGFSSSNHFLNGFAPSHWYTIQSRIWKAIREQPRFKLFINRYCDCKGLIALFGGMVASSSTDWSIE